MLKRIDVNVLWFSSLILFLLFGKILAYVEITDWGKCTRIRGSMDRNCWGERDRSIRTYNDTTNKLIDSEDETEYCLLTTSEIDGGYTNWGSWSDCSRRCSSGTSRYRYCNNPTPCNGGKDCSQLGADRLTKQCGPADGQWNSWGNWGKCITADPTSKYGNGYHERVRKCDNPEPICGGDYCVGFSNDTGNCREVPPCLSSRIFEEKFLKQDNPMIIYTSSQVEIYPLTKNKCTMATIIYNFWNLYKVDEVTGNETHVAGPLSTLKFKISAGQYDVGLYRLYTKIGYPLSMAHWMEESMYIRIMHPPPHAFIKGGSGKTVGKGLLPFDSRSVSYSLTKGPGDPSGLTFQWQCSNFVTKTLYKLLQLNINPAMVFDDESADEKKWYYTGFTEHIVEKVAWINASALYERVMYFRSTKTSCSKANEINVKVKGGSIQDPTSAPLNLTGHTTEFQTTAAYATLPAFEFIPLTKFYKSMDYMSDIDSSTKAKYKSDDVLPFPDYNELVTNEMTAFLDFYYGTNGSTFPTDTMDYFQTLSESVLTLQSVNQLQGIEGLPESANEQFFSNLTTWLSIASEGIAFSKIAAPLLTAYIEKSYYIGNATNLLDYIDIDNFMRLMIDDSGTCLGDFLGVLFEGYFSINQYDWFDMKNKERYYMEWIENELFNSSACTLFNSYDNGTGSLLVTDSDVTAGMGFLINVRVEFEGSVSYFVQHVQTVLGTPPELEIECRLNCMKKTALTSIMSLKAACLSCTYDQLKTSSFRWNVKNFDIFTRSSSDNTEWPNWMLSEPNTRKFVMGANVLNESTGYLIEAILELDTGEQSTVIWSVTTNILPYDGNCEIEDAIWGEKKVTTTGWKDEGFRSLKDASLDWKEKLNFRIVQPEANGKEIMLYYGSEEENYVKVKPGIPELNYTVTIKVQIYDIFVDYAQCTYDLGKIFPTYTAGDSNSVSTFLTDSADNIDYYWKSGNMKQVAMNAEVAGTPVQDLDVPETLFDMDPGDWVNLGTQTLDDGTTVKKSFEELLDMYYYPDTGDAATNTDIINKLTSFVETLDLATDEIESATTVNIDQIANSIGTTVINKKFVANSSASTAFKGNSKLLDKLVDLTQNETYPKYEDFIATCQGILRVLNNALEGILPKSSVETPSQKDIYSIQRVLADREKFLETEDAELTVMEKAYLASQIAAKNELDLKNKNDLVKKEVPGLLKAIRKLGKVLQELNHRKQMPVYVQNAHINSTRDKKYPDELVGNGIKHDNVKIDFKEKNVQSADELDVQVTLYDHTPFAWDTDSKYINSKTVTVSVGEENTNSVIPSKVNIPNSDQTQSTKSVNLAIPADRDEPTSQMLIYKMYWKNYEDSLIFYIRSALDYMNHVIYVRAKEHPTETDNDWMKTVETDDWLSEDEIKVIVSGGLYTEETIVHIGVSVSSSGTVNTTSSQLNSRRKRAVSNDTFDTTGNDTSINTTSISNTLLVQYYIVGATTGCRVWDDTNERWDKTSCKMSASSTINDTVCECDNPPGNNFATTFYVPPNTIDFSTVFGKFDLANNAAVFATVICLLVLYALICVWAFRQDKKDFKRWAMSYLVDNVEDEKYLYILTVYTGLHRQAGTKSNIRFNIVDGQAKKKEIIYDSIRRLDDEYHEGFPAGSIRRFVMSTAKKIEDPTVLKIWHDNKGEGDYGSWYLNKIIIEDIQTEDKFIFIFDKWLSLDHDDGAINCAVPVSCKSDMMKFSFLFNEKTRQHTTDNHLWLSVAIRPEESNFTRVQRWACCLSLLFLTMISNAMFYGQDTGQKVAFGPIQMSLAGIYISFISALIAAIPIFVITYLFKNARQRQPKDKKYGEQALTTKTNADLLLPFWCSYIAWVIVTLSVLVSGFFLILYSMEWGKSKSEQWLLAFFMSFFEAMFIIDPLKIVVLSVIFSWIIKGRKEEKVKYNREILLQETLARATSPLLRLIESFRQESEPINPVQVEKLKQKRKERLQVENTFIELVLYLVLLFVLYMISFSNRDPHWYNAKNHLSEQLIVVTNVSKGEATIKYDQITTASQFYDWLDETLIPYMFPTYASNGEALTPNQRLFIQDNINFRVGPLRLRQLRTPKESCAEEFWDNVTCVYGYSIPDEIDGEYCVAWQNKPCDQGENVYRISHDAWHFVSSLDVWGLPTTGIHNTYGGGGYMAEFLVNFNISKQLLNDLYNNIWIDRQTRAVFTEFTLYNIDNNVFVYVSLLCEFPETGGVLTSSSIKPFRPYQHVDSLGMVTFVCELIALVGIIIFAVQKCIAFHKRKGKIFQELWDYLDIAIIVLFFVCTVMYIGRWIMINRSMNKFEENKYKFVNFGHIAVWDELFNIFLATMIFLTTFRIMRVLSYNERMSQLGRVLLHVSRDLLGCFSIFLVVYFAFIGFGYLIFGRNLDTYKDLLIASTTLTNALIGKNSINDLFSISPILGRFYYFLFVLFLLWILMTMLNATLNTGISTVREQEASRPPSYGITNMVERFLKDNVGFILTSDANVKKPEKVMQNHLERIRAKAQAKTNLKRNLLSHQ